MEVKQITIEKIIAGGDGLGFIDGKAHFVPQSLIGEKLDVEIVESKKGFNRCKIVKVLNPSEFREKPFCTYYGLCGGCNVQHTSYANELVIKKEMTKDIFLRNGKLNLFDFEIFSSKDKNYRNRVQFHSDSKNIGFKKKGSNEILNIESCPLLVCGLNEFLKNNKPDFLGKVTIFSDNNINYIGGVNTSCTVNINGKEISFDPNGFFQSNLSMIPSLINHLNNYINGETVMDLYCGVGLFSSFLPSSVTNIIAVEMDTRVKPFIENNLNGKNYSFYPMSLENYLNKGLHKKNSVDTVIVDPPRVGLSTQVRSFLIKSKVKRIIYVSCDPTTMARDILELKVGGYNLTHFSCFDFYPNTFHLESFGVLDLE